MQGVDQANSPKRGDWKGQRMDAINNRSVNEAALRQLERDKAMLLSALDRLHQDKYGKCVQCGSDIPVGRLMLMPGAIRCVRCH